MQTGSGPIATTASSCMESHLSASSSNFRSEEKLGPSVISKELDVAFLLRNVLEVPEVQLESYLKHLEHPSEEWKVDLCGICEEIVNKAKRIYEEIQDAQRRFKDAKFEILSKIMWMPIKQGIKCGDPKEPEIRIDSVFSTVVGEPRELPLVEDDNMIEFEYHFNFKTEQPVLPEEIDMAEDSVAQENELEFSNDSHEYPPPSHEPNLPRTSKNRQSGKMTTSKAKVPNTLHGLKMKGRKKLPKFSEGPAQCKCGKEFSRYSSLVRHVKDSLKGPEEFFRCEICFKSKPSIVRKFKQQHNLTSHLRTVHKQKFRACRRCGFLVRLDEIKGHLKSRYSYCKCSNTPHGLKMKGRKNLPKWKEGPVHCKCGVRFSIYGSLLRHVKEIKIKTSL